MSITIYPVTPEFVAEIGDVDLAACPPDDLAAIQQAFWKFAVLIFPGQRLTQEQHLAFAAHFGPLESGSGIARKGMPLRIHSKLADVSNLDADGGILGDDTKLKAYQSGNRLWHTDASFRRVPALASLLYAHTIAPIGGHTEFADQRAAYDALPDDLKHGLAGRVAEHSIFTSRARVGVTGFDPEETERLPPVPQALVRTIPESGRPSLYVAAHAGRIFGMPDAEGRTVIDELIEHASQRQFVYTHRWRERDLVMWDNRCTMHRGTYYDDVRWRRDMHRATVLDVANSCEQEGLSVPA
jgi:alpha-ketoglutarate-dependent 2,4-dichlorophenoxyacetate dioxygenase